MGAPQTVQNLDAAFTDGGVCPFVQWSPCWSVIGSPEVIEDLPHPMLRLRRGNRIRVARPAPRRAGQQHPGPAHDSTFAPASDPGDEGVAMGKIRRRSHSPTGASYSNPGLEAVPGSGMLAL